MSRSKRQDESLGPFMDSNRIDSGRSVSTATQEARPFLPARPDRVTFGRIRSSKPRPRPPKLYRIGELVEYSGVSRQTIHNYTTMGLLQEQRWTEGGHRLYDESVFERLDLIAELKARNKSLQDIRNYFASHNAL